MAERGHRRREVGLVVGDRANKTISVDIRRLVKHPKYGKYVYRTTRCYAHDEDNAAKKGDRVEIVETRPLSKMKRWRLENVIERASEQDVP
jgi:small subunit ribosomal protein S17